MTLNRVPQPVRFGTVGGLCALLQLAFLHALVSIGLEKSVANFVALLTLAQVNFFLSLRVTWAERRARDSTGSRLIDTMARFNAMVAVSVVVNQLTFELASTRANYLVAGGSAILVAGLLNYLASDRIVFPIAGQPPHLPRSG